MIPFIMNGNGTISIMLDGSMKPVDTAHRNYDAIKEALKSKNWDAIPGLVNIVEQIQKAIDESTVESGTVVIKNGEVFFNGIVVHNTLTDRIINMAKEGFDIGHMVKFLENLMQNPSFRAVNELYDFLESGSIPITENGTFLAYKKVRDDWKDIHSGTFDNSIGTVCKMPRNMVDEDSDRTCSAGLHVCSYDYLPNFGTSGSERVVICEINPKDVVAIPKDYNNTKMRCCEYTVIGEVKDYRDSNVLSKNAVVYSKDVSCGRIEGTSSTMKSAKDLGKEFSAACFDAQISMPTALEIINSLVTDDEVLDYIVSKIENEELRKAGKAIAKAIENNDLNATQFDQALSNAINGDGDIEPYEDEDEDETYECERCGETLEVGEDECGECGYHN